MAMGIGTLLRLLVLLVACSSVSSSIASANQDILLVASTNATIRVLPDVPVEISPGSKPGTKVLCRRVGIRGLSRLKHLNKYFDSVKVNVSYASLSRDSQICFHSNKSVGIGMCPLGQWEKLSEGSWTRSISPFEDKFLDIRLVGSSVKPVEVTLVEEFYLYRVVLLVLGMVLMILAPTLSRSLTVYYSTAMAVGILLVILMVLFQGMKLLPTGRRSSFAIFMYSSVIGLGSFLLHYASRLLQSILAEIGISEDMYNPLAVFVVVFLVIAGAWLGFWAVRKLVLTDDGDIDVGVARFVDWSYRFVASIMILESSRDPVLAAVALLCLIILVILWEFCGFKFIHRLYRRLLRSEESEIEDTYDSPDQESYSGSPLTKIFKGNCFKFEEAYASPVQDYRIRQSFPRLWRRSTQGSSSKAPSQLSNSETFYSTFHDTEQRKFTKEEWNRFTRESTKKAMEGLVSSPEFSKWAVAHADRITLAPKKG